MAGFMLKATVLFAVAQLNAGETLTHTQQTMASIKQLVRREAQMEQPVDMHVGHDETTMKSTPACAENYAAGTFNETTCTASNHKTIESETVCREAAKEACPDESCYGSPFAVPKGDTMRTFPRRCFKTENNIWHFNDFEGHIDRLNQDGSPAGTPICIETEYHRGNTSSDGTTTCPDGYHVIDTEQACFDASKCMGYKPEQYFRVLNDSTRINSPIGCHINGDDNKVNFNPFPATSGMTFNETDQPLCNLTFDRGSAAGATGTDAQTNDAAGGTGATM